MADIFSESPRQACGIIYMIGELIPSYEAACYYEPSVAVVLKHCQGCMRVHVCVGFVMGRL